MRSTTPRSSRSAVKCAAFLPGRRAAQAPQVGYPLRVLLVAALGLLLAASVSAATPTPAFAQAPAAPAVATWEQALERFAERLRADVAADDVGGITAAVTRGPEVIWAEGFGWADRDRRVAAEPESIYRVGSITKSFTAVVLAQLAERGVVSLDDPVTRYLPEAGALLNETGEPVQITLRQLASHTAGLIREPRLDDAASGSIEGWEDKILASIPRTAVFQRPGTGYLYSNIGFGTLGLALSRAAGRPYMELVQSGILDPLGMNSSTFVLGDALRTRLATGYANGRDGSVDAETPLREHAGRGYKVPNGGLYTDAADLARFMAAVMGRSGGSPGADGAPVIGPRAVEWLRTIETPEDPARGYALGFAVQPAPDGSFRMGHGGSVAGYTAQIWFHPASGLGVVLLRNYNQGQTNLSERAGALLDELVVGEASASGQWVHPSAQQLGLQIREDRALRARDRGWVRLSHAG